MCRADTGGEKARLAIGDRKEAPCLQHDGPKKKRKKKEGNALGRGGRKKEEICTNLRKRAGPVDAVCQKGKKKGETTERRSFGGEKKKKLRDWWKVKPERPWD